MRLSNVESISQVFIGILAFNEQKIKVKHMSVAKLNLSLITKS